jgi:putative endonuclease
LYSPSIDKYYVGQTEAIIQRLTQHNSAVFINSSTKSGIPWELFYTIECTSRKQAVNIESHLKKIKSRKYYNSIKNFPEITEKLKIKYQE